LFIREKPGKVQSWGRYPKQNQTLAMTIQSRLALPDLSQLPKSVLPYAYGRSYGDSCLNEGGISLDVKNLNKFISFDEETGLLGCEAGVTLAEILEVFVPKGWFLPVSPGTKFVSVGGAIANDVHGKNHYSGGTFGCHVTRFELVRSDGKNYICSPTQNVALFKATIGGLGLTGLILWAEFYLKPIKNAYIDMEQVKCGTLKEFFEVSDASDEDWVYTMAWTDCLATGKSLGRSLFMRGNFNQSDYRPKEAARTKPIIAMPLDMPAFLLNTLSVKAFNTLYYNRQLPKKIRRVISYNPFFYPLDSIDTWNKLYGRRGFLQYQFVVPYKDGFEAITAIFSRIANSGEGSFLAVLKTFGNKESPGMLSFPRPGVTLALDFAFNGDKTLGLLSDLDELVMQSGGRVYPAKDARMSAKHFQAFYPNWREFAGYVDPKFSSSFWRRVTN
jgi:FAD/FMN-containing dehydrogenase